MELRSPLFNSVMQHRSNNRGHIINVVVTFQVTVTMVHRLTVYYKVLHCDYNSILIIDLLAKIYISVQYNCSEEIKSRLATVSKLVQAWREFGKVVTSLLQWKWGLRLMRALLWHIAVYGCESWTLQAGDEKWTQAFKMHWLHQILCVSWTAKRTNDWVLDKAGVSRYLLESVKASKLTYFGYVVKKKSESW